MGLLGKSLARKYDDIEAMGRVKRSQVLWEMLEELRKKLEIISNDERLPKDLKSILLDSIKKYDETVEYYNSSPFDIRR